LPAVVVQLVECLPSKEKVAGSNPVHRSRSCLDRIRTKRVKQASSVRTNASNIMNFKEYQTESRKTAIYPDKDNNYIYPTLGLSGEAGEISEKIKKVIRDKNGEIDEETRELLKKELGDVLWYISQLATEIGLSFDDIAETNIEKLLSRQQRNKLQGDGDTR
jgi:NTP pyrophosphatase (non-canonical NTP hydrolase)